MGSLAPPYAPSPLRRQRNRRTIYTFQQRSLPDPLVEVFNGPTLDLACERREASTVPTQAFGLLNSQFSNDLALAMAARLEKEAPTLRRASNAPLHSPLAARPNPPNWRPPRVTSSGCSPITKPIHRPRSRGPGRSSTKSRAN
jgi:hypothetical protein